MKKLFRNIVLVGGLAGLLIGCNPNSEAIMGPEKTAPGTSEYVLGSEGAALGSLAKKGGQNAGCTTIQDGTLKASTGETLTTGYDQWGYNYQAYMFNGLYWNNQRPDPPYTEESAPSDTRLVMKWSDEWLSNKDCNGDNKLDRGYSCDPVNASSSACEGAWLTNHQRGTNPDGTEWDYFVKMVYPPGGVVDADSNGFDDNTGGSIIWGSYVRIQQVSNDPSIPEHGVQLLVNPAGFGAYK